MSGPERRISLGFTTEGFPAGTHMCYVYNDDTERHEVMSRFVESGLQDHEKVGYFVDVMSPEEMRAQLAELGVSLPPATDERQLSITRALDTYCPDGSFLPERMLERLRSTYSGSISEGYAGARVTGEMSWALGGMPGSERLIEYEGLINTVVQDYPTTAICQYDARRFDGATLFDVLNVHPMMIVRGQVVHNPYYVAPAGVTPREAIAH